MTTSQRQRQRQILGSIIFNSHVFQILDRGETFERPASVNILEWRQWLVELARNRSEAFAAFNGTKEEWNRQWDLLLKQGVYEVEVADFLLPALSHALSVDFLMFNVNRRVGGNGPILLSQADCWGGESTNKPPLLLAYDGVHHETLLPASKADEELTKALATKIKTNMFKLTYEDCAAFNSGHDTRSWANRAMAKDKSGANEVLVQPLEREGCLTREMKDANMFKTREGMEKEVAEEKEKERRVQMEAETRKIEEKEEWLRLEKVEREELLKEKLRDEEKKKREEELREQRRREREVYEREKDEKRKEEEEQNEAKRRKFEADKKQIASVKVQTDQFESIVNSFGDEKLNRKELLEHMKRTGENIMSLIEKIDAIENDNRRIKVAKKSLTARLVAQMDLTDLKIEELSVELKKGQDHNNRTDERDAALISGDFGATNVCLGAPLGGDRKRAGYIFLHLTCPFILINCHLFIMQLEKGGAALDFLV